MVSKLGAGALLLGSDVTSRMAIDIVRGSATWAGGLVEPAHKLLRPARPEMCTCTLCTLLHLIFSSGAALYFPVLFSVLSSDS
jgi:hypothetical protein